MVDTESELVIFYNQARLPVVGLVYQLTTKPMTYNLSCLQDGVLVGQNWECPNHDWSNLRSMPWEGACAWRCVDHSLGYFTFFPLLLYLPSSCLIRVPSSHFRIRSRVSSHPSLSNPSVLLQRLSVSLSWFLQLLQVVDWHLKTEPGASDEREHVMSICLELGYLTQ